MPSHRVGSRMRRLCRAIGLNRPMPSYDAVVVGAGPNGLAAAIELARESFRVLLVEGYERVGGGTRTDELTVPGYRHDVCSTVYALGRASPFFRSLDLERYGVEWAQPEIPVGHALDGGAVVVHRDLDETAEALGRDGPAYRRLLAPLVGHPDALYETVLGPVVRVPPHPIAAARFGLNGIRSVAGLVRRFETPRARALLAGLGAHSVSDLHNPLTAAMALVMAAAAHTEGYPFIRGGSEGIARALASTFEAEGGVIETGRWVESLDELPEARVYLLDLVPGAAVRLSGDRLPARTRRALTRFRFGPGIFKVDYATSGPIPWADPALSKAGTVHVGGMFEEVAAWERASWRRERGDRPFLILTQPSIADGTRAPGTGHAVWAYAHVPNGSDVDLEAAVTGQIERFAPGFRDTVIDLRATTSADIAAYNPNNVGGDIGGGAFGVRQILGRPKWALNPYRLGNGVYLCSSSTPPGGGVHGMNGYHAARAALAGLRRSD